MKLKVAIIGCGKIAEEHAAVIAALPDCHLCAVCDHEPLMAWQLADRFEIAQHFTDFRQLLTEARPTVVHITTPPQSHFSIGQICLEHNCHIFIEKPFTIDAREAEELLRAAESRGLKMTVGHNHQFTDEAVAMRGLIADGFLGGEPVHMESTFCYDIGSGPYARAMLGDRQHWVRRLPGMLLHNVISHGVSKIAEYLADDVKDVVSLGGQSSVLQEIGEREIVDELRTTIRDARGTTAYFTFSSQMKPGRHEFRIFGPKNFIAADYSHHTLVKGLGKSYKSYLNSFLPPILSGKQQMQNGFANMGRFLRRDFPVDLGRRRLVEQFYRAVRGESPVPIPEREILATARIMDAIFAEIYGSKTGLAASA